MSQGRAWYLHHRPHQGPTERRLPPGCIYGQWHDISGTRLESRNVTFDRPAPPPIRYIKLCVFVIKLVRPGEYFTTLFLIVCSILLSLLTSLVWVFILAENCQLWVVWVIVISAGPYINKSTAKKYPALGIFELLQFLQFCSSMITHSFTLMVQY